MKKPLKDVSGTTLALTSLAILGAAAVVSTPMWMWYRRKRKRIDSLAGTPPEHGQKAQPFEAATETQETPGPAATAPETPEPATASEPQPQ
jgi:hypothetical protein